MRQRGNAFTLIELLIVVAIIAILAAIAVPNFLEAQTRSKIARTKADMRSVVVAIESYRVDNNTYPTPSFGNSTDGQSDSTFEIDNPLQGIRSMRGNRNVTTPIAYITSLPRDMFSPKQSHWFGYCMADEERWILTSLGPNSTEPKSGWLGWQGGDIQEVSAVIDTDYGLLNRTYDPTNGTISAGDIWKANYVKLIDRCCAAQ